MCDDSADNGGQILAKLVYQRKNGQWEARYKKGTSADGHTLYGTVFGKTEQEAIERRIALLGYDPDGSIIASQMNLIILGAGTHGRDVKELAESLHIFQNISFLDDNIRGENILGKCSDVEYFRQGYPCAFVAIGDNEKRKYYGELLLQKHFLVPSLVSPNAVISPQAKIGAGTVVLAQGNVGAAEVGKFCIITQNGLVNADAKLEDYSRVDNGGMVLKGVIVPELGWIRPGEIFGEEMLA